MSPLSFGLGKNLSSGGGIVTNGLVLSLDAGVSSSYPGTGTTWTDLSGNGNNGTLVNGVGYNSGSSLVDLDVQGFLGATVPSGSELDIPLETVSGTGFGATVSYASNGQIFYIQILNGGGGYTSGSVLRLPMGSNPTIVLGNLPDANPILSLTFDGTNDYISGSLGTLNAPFTLEIFGKFNNVSQNNYEYFGSVGDLSENGMISISKIGTQDANSSYHGFMYVYPGSGDVKKTNIDLRTTNYQHLVVIVLSSSPYIRVYKNGVEGSMVDALSAPINTNGNYRIGTWSNNTWWLNGNIAITKIYNRALSAAEVSQNFNALRSRYGI